MDKEKWLKKFLADLPFEDEYIALVTKGNIRNAIYRFVEQVVVPQSSELALTIYDLGYKDGRAHDKRRARHAQRLTEIMWEQHEWS